MRSTLIIFIVLLLFGNSVVESSDIHVKDEESWYEDELAQSEQEQDNNSSKESNNHHYQKLLSIEREIQMSEEMIKLYEDRLSVLKKLKTEIKMILVKQKLEYEASKTENSEEKVSEEKTQERKVQNNQISHGNNRKNLQSPAYVFSHQYEVDVTDSQNKPSSTYPVDDSIILVPPFVINKAKSEITVLPSQTRKNTNLLLKYEYGQTSNRLLFYWLQKSLQETKGDQDESEYQRGTLFTLNLALEIKPNKIKSVKINFPQKNSFSNSTLGDNFQVEETVTSYESNDLISENFKWHKALEFENQIIGFVNQNVYIKGKDKKLNEVNIGSKVLGIYSLNQYKLLYIAEDKIGTINVRSFTKSDDIRYEHYLGNRTLLKQKELQKNKDQQTSGLQDDNSHESFDPGNYWDSPFTKTFSKIRAVSVFHLETSKQVLILLSNGQILLHSNQKIIASTNLGTQLMKVFKFEHLFNGFSDQAIEKIKIKMELLPSFRHVLISSNFYNKIMFFNVTVPYLTQISKASGMSFFSSSTKSNELTSKFWQTLQISLENLNPESSKPRSSDIQIYTFINSPVLKQGTAQFTRRSSDIEDKVVYFYHCRHSGSKLVDLPASPGKQTFNYLAISEYRLLLNLFDQGNLNSGSSNVSEGRSFWWNFVLIAIIVIGVLIIRKCKQSVAQPKEEWQNPESRKPLRGKNSPGYQQTGKSAPKMTKEQDKTEKRQPSTKTKIEYDNMVISQLQEYLEKQGQKLTKQEIAFMIRQTELAEQMQKKKSQMKRQEKSSQPEQEELLTQKKNNSKSEEKQKKKPTAEEKNKPQKTEQNSKKKKQ